MIHLQQDIVSLQSRHVEANTQLQRFFQQKSHMIHLQSHLDIIMENYLSERSYLSLAAQWYGSKPWWTNVYFGLSLAAISAVIGAVLNIIVISTVLTSAVVVGLSYLLQNDYARTMARDSRLRRDIQRMSAGLAASVQHLSELEEGLTRVLTALRELNQQMQRDIERFTQEITRLEAQVQQLSAVIRSLEESNAALSHMNSLAQAQFENTRASLNQTNQKLLAESDELKDIHAHFDTTQQQLGAAHRVMMHVSDSFINNTKRMHELSQTLTTVIPKLHQQYTKNQTSQEFLLEKLSSSLDQTLESQSLSTETVGRAEAVLNKAQQELDDFSSFYDDMEGCLAELTQRRKRDKVQRVIAANLSCD